MKLSAQIALTVLASPTLLVTDIGWGSEISEISAEAPIAASQTGDDASTLTEDQRFAVFLDSVFERDVEESPEFQSGLGRKTDDYGRWDDYSEDWARHRNQQAQEDLRQLRAEFDYHHLSPDSRLSYRIFVFDRENALRNFPWRHHVYAVTQMDNIASYIPSFLQNRHTIDTRKDAEAYISRLAGVEAVMEQYVERLRQGESHGVVPPMLVYPRVLPAARNILSGVPFDQTGPDSILLADFRSKVAGLNLDSDEQDHLIEQAVEALRGPFRSGYEQLIQELVRLQRLAQDNNGVWALPDGEDYYANRVRDATTLNLSVAEIHELGLAEVARIRGEMQVIMEAIGFGGDLQAFFDHVRNDPDNYYPNTDAGREAYLREVSQLIEGVYAVAGDYFDVLPKAPLEVRRVEPWRETGSSTAFYRRPSADGSRPGIFYVNLQNMNAMQKHVINSLTYHEGAPGHHFQLAIQQELEGIPKFRMYGSSTAYVEGWALYSERLAFEAGMYEGLPLRNFGRLSEEMKRAVRLVVDTGMHWKRWTREQCIEYMAANTPMAPAEIERQIDRYFVVPGQALAYKIGMIKILELRAQARNALGADFDIRLFHDQVLRNGAMPMEVLGEVINRYIENSQE